MVVFMAAGSFFSLEPPIAKAGPFPVWDLPRAVHVSEHGVGCIGIEEPDRIGPASYGVRDIGAPDVPRLAKKQKDMIARIERYIRPTYLRFAFVPTRFSKNQFIIFDAMPGAWDGPCINAAPGYQILNETNPNLFYQPGENPFVLRAVPGDVAPTPGPWMKSR